MVLKSILRVPIFCLFFTIACIPIPSYGEDRVDLIPPDPRAVLSVAIADSDEAALLEQELGLKLLSIKGKQLYFHETPGVTKRLRELGYTPSREDPYEFYRRVVQVARRGSEQELSKMGVLMINRESTYWIVEGSLRQLIALEQLGYSLSTLGSNEPRPREIRIMVRDEDDVSWLNTIHVDIYGGYQTKDGLVVLGGAFDYQIDRIREKGFKVEPLDTNTRGEE